MTSLRKLSIQGVRSYGPDEPQVIEFLKPLTLVHGANGSGKTTIIEALRFACSGENPPLTEKGKSFVHDPKLAHSSTVKAKIMLSFVFRQASEGSGGAASSSSSSAAAAPAAPAAAAAAAAAEAVEAGGAGLAAPAGESLARVTRLFQVSEKKASREYKQSDASIEIRAATGETTKTTQKCSEIDKIVPTLLGVTPAVLNNVILCHQEDSHWPLSDSRSLKERFDEIFAATRYSKALDALKKLRSERREEASGHDAQVRVLQVRVDEARKQREKLEQVRGSVESRRTELRAAEGRIEEFTRSCRVLEKKLKQIESAEGAIRVLHGRIAEAARELQRTEAQVSAQRIHAESAAAIEAMRIEADAAAQSARLGLRDAEAAFERATASAKRSEEQHASAMRELYKLQGERSGHESKLEEARAGAVRLAAKLECSCDKVAAVPELARFASETLEPSLQTRRDALEAHRRANCEADANLEAALTQEQQRLNLCKGELASKRDQRAALAAKLVEAEQRLAAAAVQLAQLSVAQVRVEEAQKRLGEALRGRDPEAQQRERDAVAGAAQEAEARAESLADELRRREPVEGVAALRRQEAAAQEESVQVAARRMALELETLCAEPAPPHDDVERLVAFCHHAEERARLAAKSARTAQLAAQEEIAGVRAALAASEAESARATQEAEALHRDAALAAEQLAGLAVDEAVSRCETAVQRATRERVMHDAACVFFRDFSAQARTQHRCPVCTRHLPESELAAFVELNERRAADSERRENLEAVEAKLSEAQRRLEAALRVRQLTQREDALRQRIKQDVAPRVAELRARLAELEHGADEARRKAEPLNATAEALARFPARADELALAAARARAASEKARAAEQEARKAAASDVPLEVLRVQAANAHAAARRSREQLDALRRQLIASEDHERELRAEVARLCESAGSLQRLQLEREAAQRASEELRAQAAGLDTRVASLSSEMDDAQGRVDRLSRERNEERARRQKSEREAEAQLAVIEREAGDFLAQVSALRRAEERLAMLQTLERAAEDAEEMCRRQRDAVAPLLHALNEGRAAVAASEERLRVVERNRQLREREEQLSELQRELAQRRAEAGDSEPVRRELARLESELKAVVSTRDKSRGVLEAQEREAASYEQSLASPSYRDVEEAHRVEFSAACLLHKVCDDLEVYARGLDRALMRYHALKMEEINRELSEFWRAVYNGKDIDEIAIRSDHSEKGGRRAYDYRVVMRRGDTEMDMRGRCSAGQRVLASLLIRLALAQAFSVRCGVLALDEPTTNLDASNAIAFARILARLVNDRRRQDHFQLVVITHDSKFMEELGRLVGTEYYYRVFKEADQTSRIQRQPFEVDL